MLSIKLFKNTCLQLEGAIPVHGKQANVQQGDGGEDGLPRGWSHDQGARIRSATW